MIGIVKKMIASLLALILFVGAAPLARAASSAVPAPPAPPVAAAPEDGETDDGQNPAPTPPRLSYINGDVSFWRPGGEDWAPAQVNTPLAPGDQIYTGNRGNVEVQIDSRSFVRAWGDSQLGLENHEADFLQIKVTAGHVSLDLRALDGGRSVEIGTPDAAFTMDRPGYYRVDVAPDRTSFITRRGGTATMTPAGGPAVRIAAGEQVVLTGGAASVQTFAAPEQDVWDRWNYARTQALVNTASARYVPPTVAGVDDLDQHGNWRVVPEYGSVWVPAGVAADWAPYTTGRWIWDPRFGWSWVDTAPWGWAPYHYGRWVHVNHVWAWAPGPVVVRPVYAPALVAFFGAPGVRVAIGAPFVSWVALGWGEPVVPWWGRAGFVGRPWWGGWGGPRVVNNVVVNRTTVVNVTNINVYRNVNVRNAVVAVRPDRFGRGPVGEARIRQVDTRRLEPVRGAVDLRPDRSSFAAAGGRGIRPPERVLERGVVATRAPVTRALPREPEGRGPAPRIVPAPRPTEVGESRLERARPARAPRFENARRPDATPPAARREDPTGPERGRIQERGRRPEAQRVPEPPRTSEPRRAPEPRAPETPRGPEPGRAPQVQRPPQVQRAPEGSAERRAPADVPRQPRREGVDRPRAAERPAAPVPRQIERPTAPAPQPRQIERPTAPAPQPRQIERPA
ncbi:MAG TPA: DUF6600 domain-containing protein, partial [Candidatus Limnocylindria bacterium]|nr:DUF6600 domain-containing protein [Candidatus Limnocylindria bacterium]